MTNRLSAWVFPEHDRIVADLERRLHDMAARMDADDTRMAAMQACVDALTARVLAQDDLSRHTAAAFLELTERADADAARMEAMRLALHAHEARTSWAIEDAGKTDRSLLERIEQLRARIVAESRASGTTPPR